MMKPTNAVRIRLSVEDPQGTSTRTLDVAECTNLDTTAAALRAAAGWHRDRGEYRIETPDAVFGNPRGRSRPEIRAGRSARLGDLAGRHGSFAFRSALRKSRGHTVTVEDVRPAMWRASDHPLLVDLQGEIEPNVPPTELERMYDWPPTEGQAWPERADWLATLIEMELETIRGKRRGPIESHEPGNERGWRERIENPPPADVAARDKVNADAAGRAVAVFADAGWSPERSIGDPARRTPWRPCLLKRVTRMAAGWCRRADCPGCRGAGRYGRLLENCEAWYGLDPENRGQAAVVAHTRLDRAGVKNEAARLTADLNRLAANNHDSPGSGATPAAACWLSPEGATWRDPTDRWKWRTIVVQNAEAAVPDGWTRAA